ncbi:hypothetical protein D3C86_1543420 [compost metagenome]
MQQRRDLDQAIGVDAHRVHLRTHGGVGGAQSGEPHLGRGFAQGAGKGFELHFFGKGRVARVVQRGGGSFYSFAVRAGAARQVNLQVQSQLFGHFVRKLIGCVGVVAVVHPHHWHVTVDLRDHVQDHCLKRAEVGGNNGRLAQAQCPADEVGCIAAEFGVDAGEISGGYVGAHGGAHAAVRSANSGWGLTASPW